MSLDSVKWIGNFPVLSINRPAIVYSKVKLKEKKKKKKKKVKKDQMRIDYNDHAAPEVVLMVSSGQFIVIYVHIDLPFGETICHRWFNYVGNTLQ